MVCFIPKGPFINLAEQKGQLVLKIAQLLADELKEAERKITVTAQQPAHDKVGVALHFLVQNYGYERDQSTINISIKREELANLAGTTRETATRQLYKLQEEGIIKIFNFFLNYFQFCDIRHKSGQTFLPILTLIG